MKQSRQIKFVLTPRAQIFASRRWAAIPAKNFEDDSLIPLEMFDKIAESAVYAIAQPKTCDTVESHNDSYSALAKSTAQFLKSVWNASISDHVR